MEAVIKNCEKDEFINLEGTEPFQNSLTNIKYILLFNCNAYRYCIDGGLEPEQAYRLVLYFKIVPTTIRQVADVHHDMAKDCTGKMMSNSNIYLNQSNNVSIISIQT